MKRRLAYRRRLLAVSYQLSADHFQNQYRKAGKYLYIEFKKAEFNFNELIADS